MPLSSGDKLGQYEIVSLLGQGGMGEVYRARDTQLDREVAIKILAGAVAQDPERLARFAREAKVLASVNHPNIAQIYGLEQGALIMELVEGQTLAGPMALEASLDYARQMASALEFAHDKGIVHRDLKPGNVMLTREGVVKVLDFGLAKAGVFPGTQSDNSPTLSMGMTEAGMILGTAAYMSPEQARGHEVDKRTDIWAFGAVLYELLAGKPAFGGETVSDTLASVLAKEPDWKSLPPGSPFQLLRRCLEKDPKRRLRDIGDAAIEPEWSPARPLAPVTVLWRSVVVVLAIMVIAASFAAVLFWRRGATSTKVVSRLVIPLPPDQEVNGYPAISPDGRMVAYSAKPRVGEPQLYLRDLNSYEARLVPGTSGAVQPFFSPDGRWVAFYANGSILKAAVAGGSPIKVTDTTETNYGATWNHDDTIIFPQSFSSGLQRVRAGGSAQENLTKPDGAQAGLGHTLPQALPGGRNILFTILGGRGGTAVLSTDSHRWTVVSPGQGGAVYASGHLFVSDANAELRAAPFDPANPAQAREDTVVLADVFYEEYSRRPWMAVANDGTLAYAPGNPAKMSLVWTDRAGNSQPAFPEQGLYTWVQLSPDGSKAAVTQGPDIWIHDFQRGTRSRLSSQGYAGDPNWTPDGKRIIFESDVAGDFDIYSQPADASRPAEVLYKHAYNQFPSSVSPDGTLAFAESHPLTGEDLWLLSPDRRASPFLVRAAYDSDARFSPDGRWLAYDSDESGRREIYVEAYPSRNRKIAVSTGGGIVPVWSHDGKELFYLSPDSLMAVSVAGDGSFGTPRRLFDRSPYYVLFHTYDVSPDGKRFLMIRRDPGSVPRQLNVILNWSDEVRRLVPGPIK
jgi:Tol biopolymer transport system component